MQFLLSSLLGLIQGALHTQLGTQIQLPKINIPKDVRTAFSRHFQEPKLIRTPCCPKCFTLYKAEDLDSTDFCTHKDSPRSPPCNAILYREQRLGQTVKRVPATWFNTQSFRSWLEWFLSQRKVEDYLAATFNRTAAAAGSDMSSWHDSPAWADLKDFCISKYHLVFAFYIDWFNPFTNKIAG